MKRSKELTYERRTEGCVDRLGGAGCGRGGGGGGAYWVLSSGPDLQKDLASGDVEKMRAALMTADNAMLDGKQGSETRNLTIEAMKKMSMDDLMELWQGDDLTDDQREALGENLRTIWENHIGDVAEEYFVAAPEEKERILDKQIDEWKEFMDRMRAYHEANKDDPRIPEAAGRKDAALAQAHQRRSQGTPGIRQPRPPDEDVLHVWADPESAPRNAASICGAPPPRTATARAPRVASVAVNAAVRTTPTAATPKEIDTRSGVAPVSNRCRRQLSGRWFRRRHVHLPLIALPAIQKTPNQPRNLRTRILDHIVPRLGETMHLSALEACDPAIQKSLGEAEVAHAPADQHRPIL